MVAKAVTVEVDPDQALKILLAANVGKLSLILRQSAELSMASNTKVTDRDLFGGESSAPPPVVSDFRPPPTPTLPPQAPAVITRPPPPLLEPSTRKITIVRSIKSEQYEVPRELR
jgi:hypothetical protein